VLFVKVFVVPVAQPTFSALTLLVVQQEGLPARKKAVMLNEAKTQAEVRTTRPQPRSRPTTCRCFWL